ncbi:phosphotransferase family protein [Rossellomorea sp. GCM10028870]|uniref:phosphotransferase family protein n=1 Tax=Rossellomorea sp. GCM10028870 TaxID=3273426 RepID=UPI00362462D0
MSEIVEKLIREVERECKHLCSLVNIQPFASGVENCVFIGQTHEWGKVVIRVPWHTMSKNQAKRIDSREGLEKEYKLTMFCYQNRLPAPKIHLFHKGEEMDFIIQEYVPSDTDINPPLYEVGKLVKKLHQIKVPLNFLPNAHSVLSERITRNLKNFNSIFNQSILLPNKHELMKVFQSFPAKNNLLHMDIRPENILFKDQQVVGIFDWTNALMGDPVLELMRINEYGFLSDGFIESYYDFENKVNQVPDLVRWLYQMDTSLMLTLIFEELDEKAQGSRALKRFANLHGEIIKAI